MTRALLRTFVVLVACASTLALSLPTMGEIPHVAKSSCCAHHSKQNDGGGCGHHPSKSNQDWQCCSACSIGLALLYAATMPFIYSQSEEENFALTSSRLSSRFDPPPVPPPRSLVG